MTPRLVLRGGDVVTGEGVLHDGAVAVREGRIEAVDLSALLPAADGDMVVDCGGSYVCPGFIDLHNQGGGGHSVMTPSGGSIEGMARFHAAHGTTGLLATPAVFGSSFRELLPVIAGTVGTDTGGARVLGIHAEGPFLNPSKAGCMPPDGIAEPSAALLDEILEAADDTIVEMTIAPELPGALDCILELARRDIVPSLGHSDATLDIVLRAIDHGATHVTHFFNAMSPVHHREPGLAGAALYSPELTVELIADGFHVHPWMLGLTVQNKTPMLTCLVTDAMHVCGMDDGEYESLGRRVRLDGGRLSLADRPEVLAGSVLTMDRAVGNMVVMAGMPVADAVMMASATPAAVLGIDNRTGRLEPGLDADIAVLDRTFRCVMTLVGGDIVHDAMTADGAAQD